MSNTLGIIMFKMKLIKDLHMKINQSGIVPKWFYTNNHFQQNLFEPQIQNRFETKNQNQKYNQ